MAISEHFPHEPDADTGDMFTVARQLYAAAKVVLSTCPDCGYEWGGFVCYEYSDAWLEDLRAWDAEKRAELFADDDTSPSPSRSRPRTAPAAPESED